MVEFEDALRYHSAPPAGKLEIRPTKPCLTQRDLSLAYTPGVAVPCRAIHAEPDKVFEYTAKGNLVAVVTNGTAVLGLGDIGPMAGKPVMEGKAVLFKRFAGIDVFDIELDAPDVDTVCRVVKALAPTFGGINLEDIKAPDCFLIEERLRAELDIPVFHDDQHGTAIITAAGLVNAVMLTEKRMDQVRVVFSGAGAAALATAKLIQHLGVVKKNIVLCDSKGVVHSGSPGLDKNPYKAEYAVDTSMRTLADALVDADVFIGVSVANCVTPDMLRAMAPRPIVFALANPDPEIPYDVARATRPDAIVATGRSDFPNQVNNVLGFPFIFRGALDARARTVNEAMMIAAANALAELAREEVDEAVSAVYGGKRLRFGPDYIIPKPFDQRVLLRVAPAVALAATFSGVARRPIKDVDAYTERLERMLGKEREVMRHAFARARGRPRRIAFADGEHDKVLRAAGQLLEEGITQPILIGRESVIRERAAALELELPFDSGRCRILDPRQSPLAQEFAQKLFERRCRRGMTLEDAQRLCMTRTGFAAMLARQDHAAGLIAGLGGSFPETLRPVLQIVGTSREATRVSGVHLMVMNNEIFFFADTTLTLDPTAEELAETACLTADLAAEFGVTPRIAMLSFSNFGSVRNDRSERVRRAVELVMDRRPELEVDGEMHADTALLPQHARELAPFIRLSGKANVLVFPSLESGNIAQKIAQCTAADATIGPILIGLGRAANILPPYASVTEIVMTAAITAMLAGRHDPESTEVPVDLAELAQRARRGRAAPASQHS
jgi:malate dehydrogenase (oxaloacetate-decarboxylating)(NADP+)